MKPNSVQWKDDDCNAGSEVGPWPRGSPPEQRQVTPQPWDSLNLFLQIMDDHNLGHSFYENLKRNIKPVCPGCLDMNLLIFDWRIVQMATSYPNLDPQKIVDGVRNHCTSCTMINAAFHSIGLDLHAMHDPRCLSLYGTGQNGGLMAQAVHDQKCSKVELYIVKGSPSSPWSIVDSKTQLSGDTGSEAAFHLIQQWVHKCNVEHQTCRNQSNAALPTRVIDLGRSNDSIRLVETHGLSGPYICLSHCWGGFSTILCTRGTYSSYQNNIPWSSLPLLFRDTVGICRMLGIQYLWIDKLCIIQHDEDDWAREGSRMAQIFEGSFLTIGAAVSRNDTESLFTQDERRSSSLESYVGQRKDGSSYTIYFRKPLDYHPANSTISRPNCERYPLLSRAWVYQERLLAPRILYFGEELSWECRNASACECSGVSHGTKHGYSLSLSPGFPIEKLYLQWQKMIEEFTWLQLSHEEDRLPAFSGLAQQYQQRLKSEYLAGLWRENLLADLMWYTYPESGGETQRYYTKKPRNWRAPSWSWASVEGPILFSRACSNPTDSITYSINITSAECIPSSLDPLGTVTRGQLTIKGSGRPARLKHREKWAGQDTRHYSVNHPSPYSVSIRSNFTVDGQEANVDYDLIEQGLMKPNSDMSIYCLHICGMVYMHRTYSLSRLDYNLRVAYKTWSLLLHRVDDKVFERVGLLVSEHFDGGESRFRDSLSDCTITVV